MPADPPGSRIVSRSAARVCRSARSRRSQDRDPALRPEAQSGTRARGERRTPSTRWRRAAVRGTRPRVRGSRPRRSARAVGSRRERPGGGPATDRRGRRARGERPGGVRGISPTRGCHRARRRAAGPACRAHRHRRALRPRPGVRDPARLGARPLPPGAAGPHAPPRGRAVSTPDPGIVRAARVRIRLEGPACS